MAFRSRIFLLYVLAMLAMAAGGTETRIGTLIGFILGLFVAFCGVYELVLLIKRSHDSKKSHDSHNIQS